MAQTKMLKARGLYTFPNLLSEIPEGALTTADNVIISRNSVLEPRRGLAKYGTSFDNTSDRTKQLLVYKGRILRHYSDIIDFDNGSGTFSAFDGSYTEVETGLRIKFVEANGNLYFTTDEGIKKISAKTASDLSTGSGYIRESGAPQALDITATINYDTAGFLLPESKVAYKVVWGYKDNNNNLILGASSQRVVVTNYSTTDSGTVDLEFSIPSDISTTDIDYFYQIYRTAVFEKGSLPSLDDVDPGEEVNLVIEDFPSSTELTNRIVEENDITPEDFRNGGTPLYSNPVSGDGVLQSNDRPPLAKDICLFKESVFYANTQTRHQLEIDFLSVQNLVSGTSTITITNESSANTYTFVGAAEVTDITFDTQANTTDGGYFLLNSASNERKYVFYADKTGSTAAPTGSDTLGRLIYAVDISAATTPAEVALEFANVINNLDDFVVPLPGSDTITVTNSKNGNTDDAVEGSTAMGGVFAINVTTQGDGEDDANLEVLLSSAATPSQQIDETARSLINIINRNPVEIVEAFYLSGQNDVPGQILLKAKDLDTAEFYLNAESTSTGEEFNPILPVYDSGSVATGIGTVTVTATSHGLSDGDEIIIYNSTTTPTIDGVYTISNSTTNTFDISTTINTSGNIDFSLTDVNSDNEVQPNVVFFSKYQEPEAVPTVNQIPIGPKDKEILRILPLRESLFVLKEDGIYRITGEQGNFIVDLFDSNCQIVAPDSAVVLNNQIYMLTTQDISTVSDTGVSVLSRPIEDTIVKLVSDNYDFKFTSFGVSYDTDRAYLLWVPSNTNDTVATQCFRYDLFTNSWTRWPISKTCGIINPANNRLYTGAADDAFIEQERKNFKRTDYADREFELSIGLNAIGDLSVELSSAANADIGDALVQTQYVTIFQFNQLLQKLDLDPGVADSDYYSLLQMSSGDNLANSITSLVAKLNADSGTMSSYTFSGTTDFETIQTEYNTIISTLNTDLGVQFSNYQLSSGTVDFETVITGKLNPVNSGGTNIVQVTFNLQLMQGPIVLYKFIPINIIWAPYTFGDPSMMKHVREGTLLFENNRFTFVELAYNTDLSVNFETSSHDGQGVGDWGQWYWDELNWGGKGSAIPIRTYIPRNKQRCRFINARFKHKGAREKFSIFGISYTFRVISERAYRDF